MRMLSYLSPGYPAELFTTIAARLGAALEFDPTRSGPDLNDDPFLAGRADIGWVCSTSLVELTTGREPSVRDLGIAWVPDDPTGNDQPVYFSEVVVGADSEAVALADLSGQRIGCNDRASLSGCHSLRIELAQRGHDPDRFAELTFTGGHDQSIEALTAGALDAAVIDSVIWRARRRDDPDLRHLRVVARLGPWPTQPMVVRASLDPERDASLRACVLSANHDADCRRAMRAAGIAHLVETAPGHCDTVRTAMGSMTAARLTGSA